MLELKHRLIEAQERIKALEKELKYSNSHRVVKKKLILFLIDRAKKKQNVNVKTECYNIAEIVSVSMGTVRNYWTASCKGESEKD